MNTERYLIFTDCIKKFRGYAKQSGHVVTLTFEDEIPSESEMNGFTWYINNASVEPDGDYTAFTTVFRYDAEDNIYQMSDDGSVYITPIPPTPPEPYIPTLEEVIEAKVTEMNTIQQDTISNGVDATLIDGRVEHFTLTEYDQTSLMGLKGQVDAGAENIPWHNSDQAEHCKYYSNADMNLIVIAAMSFITFHVTYFRDLRIYIRELTNKEDVSEVTYGMTIPIEYQSQVLQDLLINE